MGYNQQFHTIRYWLLFPVLIFCEFVHISAGVAQDQKSVILKTLDAAENRAHMEYLASDELRGRDIGTQELKIAARYLVEKMQKYGVSPLEGAVEGHYQPVPLKRFKRPDRIDINALTADNLILPENRVVALHGGSGNVSGLLEYVDPEMGLQETDNVTGKILLIEGGQGLTEPSEVGDRLENSNRLYEKVLKTEANAIIEIYRRSDINWNQVQRSLEGTKIEFDEKSGQPNHSNIPHIIIYDPDGKVLDQLRSQKDEEIRIDLKGGIYKKIRTNNVVGLIEGTDSELKDEYILLTAHYDHIGIKKNVPAGQDSINNGARDNGIGMVALLNAAKNIAQYPLKRSVLFLFATAEEKGLLGSRWYAEHPLVPLRQTIFNLNIDGAGYNDTTKVVVVGLNRTSASDHFKTAANSFELEVTSSPQPQLNLFYRSDNINFARKGIPAPTFTQGFTGFNREIQRYYHQPADEAATLNYRYLNKYYGAFTLALRLIANDEKRPEWLKGIEFIEAYQKLYK